MQISEFIQTEVLLPRVQRHRVLVVYDPDRRFRILCLGLSSDNLQVIDAADNSIESRESALQALGRLGASQTDKMDLLIYVPARAPVSDEDRQRDPFAVYAVCGGVFPDGDGDEYLSICLKAKPDHATEIRGIFDNHSTPDFTVIDAVGRGLGWPTLRALLGAESAHGILFALLAPNDQQQHGLKGQETWAAEARNLFNAALGLKLKTRSNAWSTIADELWRFLLFSEFVFDLPEALPAALADVPHAAESAQPLVEGLCERLRNDLRARVIYIDRADAVERDLNLPALCAGIVDLGTHDTFPFEERTFFARALGALQNGNSDRARSIVRRHSESVWVGKGESRAQWGLIQAALELFVSCDDFERQLPEHSRSQDALIDFYLIGLSEADQRQREFEQAVGDHLDIEGTMAEVVDQARSRYRRLSEKVQMVFTKHLETSGWPPAGRLANGDIFDQHVSPLLQESGRRVAYFLVDALRYELGVALHQQLADDDTVELLAAFAQLPSITVVGMASLLPEAGMRLTLARKEDGFVPMIGDAAVANVNQRMELLRRKYGDRFAESKLNDFVRSRKDFPKTVQLLVLRNVDIDSQLENNPETTLSLIHDTLKRIRVAIHKLKKTGFDDFVIATDHGFFLNAQAEAGDVCSKPAGHWINVHERTLLGDGTADSHNFVVSAEKLGIRGDFRQVAGPRSMAPYRAGMLYFHGGASLQEAVVPVLIGRLRAAEEKPDTFFNVVLSYKNQATRITTRLPVVDLLLETTSLFAQAEDFEVLLEAHAGKDKIVGEAKAGGVVNAATGVITLKPGQRVQVTLAMQREFEGKFTLKALNPKTLMVYSSLELKTDYVV